MSVCTVSKAAIDDGVMDSLPLHLLTCLKAGVYPPDDGVIAEPRCLCNAQKSGKGAQVSLTLDLQVQTIQEYEFQYRN